MIDLELRKKTEASLKPEQKPQNISPYYLVGKYYFASWHCIGCETLEIAESLKADYIKKGATGVEIVNEYPYEILVEWKKKDKNG